MKKTLTILSIPLIAIMLYYVFGTNTQNFEETIAEKREQRLHFLNNSSSSPVEDKEQFVHSGFFPADKKFRTNGKIVHNPKTQQIALQMSGGTVETYIHYGIINFTLLNQKQTLVLFQNLENPTEYLLPFSDNTNGNTTYGAGRHLPVNFSGGNHIVLDFNLAESPFCAFNHSYNCPLPPASNKINLAVEAGEKANK